LKFGYEKPENTTSQKLFSEAIDSRNFASSHFEQVLAIFGKYF
jgi:hypothetical protein